MIKKALFVISGLMLFISCRKEKPLGKNLELERIKFDYTQNIEVKKNESVVAYRFLFANNPVKEITLPLKRIAVNGTSVLGYLEALKARDKIIALTNPHYVYDSIIRQNIENHSIKSIGGTATVNIEAIVKLHPDVFFSYSDPNMLKVHEKLEDLGIPVVLIDEFKEKTPLAKAEWVKFIGILLGKDKQAEVFFDNVEAHYHHLKEKYSTREEKPTILVNTMYGDVWYLPNNESFLAQFIKDAGGDYVFKDDKNTVLNYSFEKVFSRAKDADLWINASNVRQLKELEAQHHNYTLFEAFQNGEVYALTGSVKGEANNYFEEGIVRPDLILKDLTQIFYPLEDQKLLFYTKLIKTDN